MEIIVDTNILFSGIIKDSLIRKIIILYPTKFLVSEYTIREIKEHIDEIKNKTKLEHNEYYSMFKILVNMMETIKFEELEKYKEESIEIMKDIDMDDALIIATALSRPNSIIWSDDKALKRQNTIRIYNTSEMINFILEL